MYTAWIKNFKHIFAVLILSVTAVSVLVRAQPAQPGANGPKDGALDKTVTSKPALRDWPQFDRPPMVLFAETSFLMGSPVSRVGSADYREEKHPQRVVTVKSFYLARYLVTAEEFCQFLNDGDKSQLLPRDVIREEEHATTIIVQAGKYLPRAIGQRSPAYPVSWNAAVAYCDWLSKRTGREMRLPTESE